MKTLEQQIDTIRRANAVMRAANLALKAGDDIKLVSLGFSIDHIQELKGVTSRGAYAFPLQSIKNNESLIRFLKKQLQVVQKKAGTHGR